MLSCRLCTYTANQLHQHIFAVHNMTSSEYRAIYGSHEIMQVGHTPPSLICKKNEYRSNYVKNGYIAAKIKLDQLTDIYSKEETRDILMKNDFYLSLFGKSKNRTLINHDIKLYNSIYIHTAEINNITPNNRFSSLPSRIKIIILYEYDISKLKCNCGKSYSFTGRCRYCPLPRLDFRAHSIETRKKIRLSTIQYLQKCVGQLVPRYNVESISLIEQYGKENGYNFQHAENGGEYFIRELGYWVDGYDKEKNVVLEIDESHHFDKNGNYTLRDKIRQQEIENHLGCKFIRIPYE